MTWHWPRHREFQERLWSAIEREPPAFLVVSQTRFSLVRSPQMDPFLETRLQELGEREYGFDAALVRERDGRFRLRHDRPAEPDAEVFFELWRRRTGARG
jgi:hypothetical protein